MTFRILALLLPLSIVAACDLVGPSTSADITHISLRLALDPEEIAPGDTTEAMVEITNDGLNHTRLITQGECMIDLYARRDAVSEALVITSESCWPNPTGLALAPGDTVVKVWKIVANTPGGDPADEGEYMIGATVDAQTEKGTKLGNVAVRLTVQ